MNDTAQAVLSMLIVGLANVLTYVLNEHSLVRRCCKTWPSLVFASNRRAGSPPRPAEYWAFDVINPDDATSSYFVSTPMLLLYRIGIVAYFGAELVVEGLKPNVSFGHPGYVWISFFTDWTFCLFGFTGVIGTVVTAQRWHEDRSARTPGPLVPSGAVAPTPPAAVMQPSIQRMEMERPPAYGSVFSKQKQPRPASRWTVVKIIHLLSVETAASSTLFLTVFYWVALASGSVTADNVMKHGANNGVILGDVLLSRVPFVSYHFQVVLLYGTLYVIFMVAVWWPVKNYWVYSTFDWSKWRVVGAYAALPVCIFVAFLIYAGIARIREPLGRCWQASGSCRQPSKHSLDAGLQLADQQARGQEVAAGVDTLRTPGNSPV